MWNFAQNWEEYYEKPWNGCRVKSAPALSRYAIGTHNSMGKTQRERTSLSTSLNLNPRVHSVWAIDPRLRSEDGRQLPVRFTLALRPTIAAHTCETYNGHHTLFQRSDVVYAQEWDVNVADLNNIRWT